MWHLFKSCKLYSLHKSRSVLKNCYHWYQKKGGTLSNEKRSLFESQMEQLDQALIKKDRATADEYAKKLESFNEAYCKKSYFEYAYELFGALLFALIIATVVRQSWFELYEIPTGSMRPTFKEKDHLTVSKLPFGINIPLETDQFYFDPTLVQRGGVVIFSGDKMAVIDEQTNYFGLIPYTKRYIKRLIGKPGDALYFYGGQIYVVDENNQFVDELIDTPWMKGLEHIPFLNFEGMITAPTGKNLLFNQMHTPIGKLSPTPQGSTLGEIFDGEKWIKDNPEAQKQRHDSLQTYSDFFGMRNFAMARLLTKEQISQELRATFKELPKAPLYLELRHTPSMTYPKPRIGQDKRGITVSLTPYTTLIPLQKEHLNALMDHMYTTRFEVKDGVATRYRLDGSRFTSSSPSFPKVEDGTYEFYYGKGYKVHFGGITTELSLDHPLYSHDPAHIQKLFNLGIDMDLAFTPNSRTPPLYPQRYAYFRDGDLYLLGGVIIKKEDPTLATFHDHETKRASDSTYVAFKDYGPPINEKGEVDKAFIKTFGVKVPKRHYLVLGDNHAMSSDSRVFGFVPQENLQGAPSLILWPPGERFGQPMQRPYPIFVFPRLIVWAFVAICLSIWYGVHRYRLQRPIFKRKDFPSS